MVRGEERADDRQSAALDVSLPFVALLLVGTVATLVTEGELVDRARSMDWWFFAITGAGVAGLAGTSTLSWLARRGRKVPVGFMLLFATLPWLTGLGGLRFRMHRVEQALERADWFSRGLMAVLGYSEASASAAYGAILSAALLGATAVVLALRTERVARPRALTPTIILLVVVGSVGPAIAIADVGAASVMLLPLVAALVAFVACAGRAGAPSVAIAVVLATIAACSATMIDVLGTPLRMIASVGSDERRDLLEQAVLSHHVLARAAWIAIGAISLAGIVVVGESARRMQRASLGRAIALVSIAVCMVALHRVATVSATRSIEAWTKLPWQDIDGFVLARTPDGSADEPWLVVSADGVIRFGETRLSTERGELRQAIAEERRRREEIERQRWELEREETPEWLQEPLDDDVERHGGIGKRARPREVSPETSRFAMGAPVDRYEIIPRDRLIGIVEGCALESRGLRAAIDHRVSATSLFDLVTASGQLTIIGRLGDEVPNALRAIPALANLVERDSLSEFSVSTPLGSCNPNPGYDVLLTAVVGTEPISVVRDYETGAELSIQSDLRERRNEQPGAVFVVFARPAEGATVQHLADFAGALQREVWFPPIILVRDLPVLPPVPPLPTEVADAVRDARVTLHPRRGTARAVIEERRADLDHCAHRVLTLNPDLSGDMHVYFRIASDGHVESARSVGGTAALRPMRACVEDAVEHWTHPAREEPTRESFRLILGDPEQGG